MTIDFELIVQTNDISKLQHIPIPYLKCFHSQNLLELAACYGAVECLDFLLQNGFEWMESIPIIAAQHGQLRVLQYTFKVATYHHCSNCLHHKVHAANSVSANTKQQPTKYFRVHDVGIACMQHHHYECFQYVCDNIIVPPTDADRVLYACSCLRYLDYMFYATIEQDRFDYYQYMLSLYTSFTKLDLQRMVQLGSVRYLQYAHEHTLFIVYTPHVLHLAVKYNREDIVDYTINVLGVRLKEDEDFINTQQLTENNLLFVACKHNNLKIVQDLVQLGCTWISECTPYCIKHQYNDILRYCFEQEKFTFEHHDIQVCIDNNNFDMLCYVHEVGLVDWPRDTTNFILRSHFALRSFRERPMPRNILDAHEHISETVSILYNFHRSSNELVELQLKYLDYVRLRRCPWHRYSSLFACAHIKLLTYVHTHGCTWHSNVTKVAASIGNLECLQYAHTNGCDMHEMTAMTAARRSLDCLEYAYQQGCIVNSNTTVAAIYSGKLEIVEFCHIHNMGWESDSISLAAKCGHIDIVKYAHSIGCTWNLNTSLYIASSSDEDRNSPSYELMEYMLQHQLPFHPHTLVYLAKAGDYGLFKHLYKTILPSQEFKRMASEAFVLFKENLHYHIDPVNAVKGNLMCICYAITQGCEVDLFSDLSKWFRVYGTTNTYIELIDFDDPIIRQVLFNLPESVYQVVPSKIQQQIASVRQYISECQQNIKVVMNIFVPEDVVEYVLLEYI